MRLTSWIIGILLVVLTGLIISYPKVCTIIQKDIYSKTTNKFIALGTGGVTGIYYHTGGEICKLVNKNKEKVKCSIESTGGSVYNLNAILSNELDLGISQSDLIYHAYHGTHQLKSVGANPKLRTVFTLYTEPLTIVARQDAHILTLQDLKKKRINIGSPGSGQRATVENLMQTLNWEMSVFKQVSTLNPVEQSQALCDDKIDAMIFAVGHPNGSIQEAASSCKTRIIEITGPEIDKMIAEKPYYIRAFIPGETYNLPNTLSSFGGKVSLVTSEDMQEEIIYEIAKNVMENFETFQRMHPVFSGLTKYSMIHEGIIAPLHKGAVKYYKEANLLEENRHDR